MAEKAKLSFICILFGVIDLTLIHGTTLVKRDGTVDTYIDGSALVSFGREHNKPLITLIGVAIRNLERRHRCDDWTTWTDCADTRKGYFATRNRTRRCKVNSVVPVHKNKASEVDTGICEGFCPNDYNMTAKGFCVKLYADGKTYDDAESQCRADGGHMVNIDSESKNKDLMNTIKNFGYYVYIDGRRTNTSSPWMDYSGLQKEYFNWPSGEPGAYMCTRMFSGSSHWYGYSCTSALPFVCEVAKY